MLQLSKLSILALTVGFSSGIMSGFFLRDEYLDSSTKKIDQLRKDYEITTFKINNEYTYLKGILTSMEEEEKEKAKENKEQSQE